MPARIKNIVLNLVALMIGCVFVLGVLAAGEVVLRLRSKSVVVQKHTDIENNLSDFTILDPVMGMKHLPHFKGTHTTKVRGEEIYKADYAFDGQGHRITPVDHPESREGAALFFGCSFMFGLGVEQDETLPACFGRECESLLPMNFAVGGYGPQHLWLQLEDQEVLNKIPRDHGVIVYGFFNSHILRLLGKRSLVEDWGDWLPWLSFSEGRVEKLGFMGDKIWHESRALKVLKSLHMGRFIIKRLGVLNNQEFSEEEGIDGIVKFFLLIQQRIAEILPSYRFVVLAYPWTYEVKGLAEAMKEAGIPFYDYTKAYPDQDENKDKYFYRDGVPRGWGHLKANVYAHVAKWLAEDLGELCEGKSPSESNN
jgi:hypothetical protein